MTTNKRPEQSTSIREVLADSHVAAVAIAVLVIGALDSVGEAVWPPLNRILTFLGTAIAIRDIPYFGVTILDRMYVSNAVTYGIFAVSNFLAAWILSRWVYGAGPIRSFADCAMRMSRR